MYSDDMAYIMQTEYDEMGRKRMIRYGNGAESHYSYDRMQRLALLKSYTSSSETMQALNYHYDQVGNITSLYNMASTLYNGMGGQYTKDYQYDNLYRLSFMQASFGALTSSLEMAYSANGRILQKTLHADMPGMAPKQYTNGYEYQGSSNLLKELNKGQKIFRWDDNGNMAATTFDHPMSKKPFERWFCWDDENRLSAVSDPNYRSNYLYDATGERVFKAVGKVEYMNVNERWYSNSILDNAVLYTSPYMVATPQGYTKHYYAGDNRIASRIGEGRFSKCIVTQGVSPFLERQIKKTLKDESKSYFKYPKYTGIKDPPQMAELPFDYLGSPVTAPPPYHGASCYWYHTDHLGSSSWITDEQGQAVQYLDYLPFGEPWINQRSTGWNARYTFSGKERDQETGYSYFGARYYDADLSMWLSVDPLADRYWWITPYAYCANNPIRLIDPDGRAPWDPTNVKQARRYARTTGGTLKIWNASDGKVASVARGEGGGAHIKVFNPTNDSWGQKIGNFFRKQDRGGSTYTKNRGGAMLITNKIGSPQGPGETTDVDVPMMNVDDLPVAVPGAKAAGALNVLKSFIDNYQAGANVVESIDNLIKLNDEDASIRGTMIFEPGTSGDNATRTDVHYFNKNDSAAKRREYGRKGYEYKKTEFPRSND